MPAEDSWRHRRGDAVARQVDLLEQRRAAESARAAAMLRDFVATAAEREVPTTRLRARGHRGSVTYRTPVVGWYLRADRSVGVGTDGNYYVLSTPGGLRAWLFGSRVTASDPPLVLGLGARDGESVDLADALRRALGGTDSL